MSKYLKLFIWIAAYLTVSFLIGHVTQGSVQGWYQELTKPSFNPPNWIFPVVWSLLYIMIASAGWNLWEKQAAKKLKIAFITYTVLNWTWTPIFFGAHLLLPAALWLMLINAAAIFIVIAAWKDTYLTAKLMILPLFWTIFAFVLNFEIWRLNV